MPAPHPNPNRQDDDVDEPPLLSHGGVSGSSGGAQPDATSASGEQDVEAGGAVAPAAKGSAGAGIMPVGQAGPNWVMQGYLKLFKEAPPASMWWRGAPAGDGEESGAWSEEQDGEGAEVDLREDDDGLPAATGAHRGVVVIAPGDPPRSGTHTVSFKSDPEAAPLPSASSGDRPVVVASSSDSQLAVEPQQDAQEAAAPTGSAEHGAAGPHHRPRGWWPRLVRRGRDGSGGSRPSWESVFTTAPSFSSSSSLESGGAFLSYTGQSTAEGLWAWVNDYDELRLEMRAGHVFADFCEGPITFPPPFRWRVGKHAGDYTSVRLRWRIHQRCSCFKL